MEKSEIKGFIAKRVAQELKDGDVVNLDTYIAVHMQGCRAAIPCCIAKRSFIVTTTGQSDDGEC